MLQYKLYENKKIPKCWLTVSIGEISNVVSGGTPRANNPLNFSAPNTGIAWLTPADLSGYTEKYISHGARDLSQLGYESSSAKLIPAGSLLFSSRAPIGYVAIASNEVSTSQGFKSFIFPHYVDSNYAYYYLFSIRGLAESFGTGTTFKEISSTVARTLPFILPPLAEQKIIASKLDVFFEKIETTRASLESIISNLKKFRRSVLNDAMNGKLTLKWRESYLIQNDFIKKLSDNKQVRRGVPKYVSTPEFLSEQNFPDSWDIFSIATLLRKGVIFDLKDGNHGVNHPKSFEFTESGLPFITASQIQDNGNIDYDNAPKVSGEVLGKLKVGFAKVSDVIYSHKGTVGRVGIADRDCILSPQTTYIRLNPEYVSNRYYQLMLGSNVFTNQVDAIKSQTTRDFVPIMTHYGLFVVLPPLKEQLEIVNRVEELFTFVDSIEQEVNIALDRVNSLPQSILVKAFQGDLTADWREANPELISGKNSAEALLRKIKTEHEILKKQSTTKRRITPKKKVSKNMSSKIITVTEALIKANKPLSGQQLLNEAGYSNDSTTEELEKYFLDIREALLDKKIVQLERDKDQQDWFALAETTI